MNDSKVVVIILSIENQYGLSNINSESQGIWKYKVFQPIPFCVKFCQACSEWVALNESVDGGQLRGR